uniref:Tol-pal system protein YbgF n=1 Tax=candidate division WOR-3 bacterium TaxID=2052148 RepID=A0A7C6EC30_UNCW3
MIKDIKLILFLFLLFSNCSIKRQWEKQTNQIDFLTKQVAQLDSLQRQQGELLLELKADLSYRLERTNEKIDYLDAKIEDSEARLIRIAQKLGLRTTQPETVPADTTMLQQATADPEALYNTAYLDFTRGNLDLAIQGFRDYLKLYPDTDLSDNAQYWIGESYFTKQEWQMALIEFEKVEKNYPKGNKLPAALYKIGLCYLNMQIRNKGKEYLNRVIKEFPNSPEADLAKERLATLR